MLVLRTAQAATALAAVLSDRRVPENEAGNPTSGGVSGDGEGGGEPGSGGESGDGGGEPKTVVIDDDLRHGPLSTSYAGLSWEADWYVYHRVGGDYESHSGEFFITNLDQSPSISFTFPGSVRFLGAWFSPPSGTAVHFDAYDIDGIWIDSSDALVQTVAPQFLSFDTSRVHKVTVTWSGSDFAMDDVTYITE